MNLHQIGAFWRFYRSAATKYQLHSTFVFELAVALLEDQRWYYAFRDVEILRQKMLESDVQVHFVDLGSGGAGHSIEGKGRLTGELRSVRSIARRAGSSARQGQMLFRLANFLEPKTILELGTSVGIGTMYLASAARDAQFISLEGSAEIASVARTNLEYLQLSKGTEIIEGPFANTLIPALKALKAIDLVFFDGNHRKAPTIQYFETCIPFAHNKTVFVLDDMHSSVEMSSTWESIKNHPRVTLTMDFFEISLVFIDPDFREKQHFQIVPAKWKPWMFF